LPQRSSSISITDPEGIMNTLDLARAHVDELHRQAAAHQRAANASRTPGRRRTFIRRFRKS